jgi:serine protease inhibitor
VATLICKFPLQNEDPLIEFYKARVGYFYGGSVDVVDFSDIDNAIRDATNRRVAMKTDNRVKDAMHHDHPVPEPPMAMFAANYFKVKSFLPIFTV